MPPARDADFDSLLSAARAQFAAGLPDKARVLGDHMARAEWDRARRMAHQLRGSAATYGFAVLGQVAAAVEETLLASGGAPGDIERGRLQALVAEMAVEAQRAAGESKP